ncbi:MAG: sulfite exporter TauE/SafE family protein [Myxococcales bacterium]|nr:sulfite exporter TauE/SafE family protein [Myxococcales bacterium]
MIYLLIYVFTGIFAGLAAGLLGVGGGIVNVPALDFIFCRQGIDPDVSFHLALGTSLAIIVFTSASAAYAHWRRGTVDVGFGWRAGLGGIVGSVVSSFAAAHLQFTILKPAFALFLIFAAVRLLTEKEIRGREPRGGPWLAVVVGFLAGLLAGFFGVGGGIIAIPLMLWIARFDPPQALATSNLIIVLVGIFGSFTYLYTGWTVTAAIPHAAGYVHLLALIFVAPLSILTARLGVRLAHAIDSLWLKRLFALMLFAVGWRFVWDVLYGG